MLTWFKMIEDTVCFNIKKNDTYGRYAVASKPLEPGDLITVERPFAYGPKSDSAPICLGCHSGVDCQTMCKSCGWPVCSEQCEKLPVHAKNECVVFSLAKIKFTPVEDITVSCPQYECITPLRVLLAKERQPEIWEADLKLLESHEEERKKMEIWHAEAVNIVGFLHKVCKLQDRFSEKLIHFVCGVLEVNAFSAPASFGCEIRCLYPKTSLLSHSCVPNVGHYIFTKCEDGVSFRIKVRAMVKIEKDQELFLSYTSTLAPTLFRRSHLKDSKFFYCTCKRCADPTELGTNMSTLKCSKCDNGWVLSTNSLDELSHWKCTCCEYATKGESVMKLFRIIEKEIEKAGSVFESDPVASREALIKKYCSVLHPNNALLLNIKASLTQLYGKAKGYILKDLPDTTLRRKIELCNLIDKVSKKIKPGLSRQRGWNLYELHAPLIIMARNQLQRREINEKQMRVKLEEAAKHLEEVALIFCFEEPESPEGIVGQIAKQSLIELIASIESLPK